MISLQDEISKFQKMVYNKELNEFVSMDQMFVGGGITIESLIHENSFIVEELKKMNAVFRNYCKLNDKVYKKIMEHELGMHSEQARLNALLSAVDRKLDDSLKIIKELHEDTLFQNQRSTNMINDVLAPIRQEIADKVDMKTFTIRMKQVLEEYDEGAFDREEGSVEGALDSNGMPILDASGMPVRKKGKVGFDQFYKLKEEIERKLKGSDAQLKEVSLQSFQTKETLMKYVPIINKSASQVFNHSNQIYKMSTQNEEKFHEYGSTISKLQNELNHRLSDHSWNVKFEHFFDKFIRPPMKNIEDGVLSLQGDLRNFQNSSSNKFKQIDTDLNKAKSDLSTLNTHTGKLREEMHTVKDNIKENEKLADENNKLMEKSIEDVFLEGKKLVKESEKHLKSDMKEISKTIENLAHTIEDTVMKAVGRKIEMQLKVIEANIKDTKEGIKNTGGDVNILCEQIKNVKDILSRKANFTDIVQHIERKADKQDFKELQSRFNETSQQFISKQLNESITINPNHNNSCKVQRPEISTRRVNTLSRGSKTLLPHHSTPNNKLDRIDPDMNTKLFMCGLETHMGQNRKIFSQNSRRRSLKSSTAVINDFTL